MNIFLKKIAARLPRRTRQSLKRRYFAAQLRRNRFQTDEPESEVASDYLEVGDWVLDIGANIGHYTLRFSNLVKESGRVIAFEPVPDTFELLAANVSFTGASNVTLINAAASNSTRVVGIEIPKFDFGLDNFYMAHLSTSAVGLQVLCLPVDSLDFKNKISLVKIDAEGHDYQVLQGMEKLLRRDHPTLIIEDCNADVLRFLEPFAYTMKKLPGSPNTVFTYEYS